MITSIYQLYMMYRYLVMFHGVYVTFSFFRWFLGTTYEYFMWFLSFVYEVNVVSPLQIEDKHERKQTLTEKTCRSDEPIHTLDHQPEGIHSIDTCVSCSEH